MTKDGSSRPFGGRVAVVTGAGRGIGAAIALRLSEMGVQVVLAGRSRKPLDATADIIHRAGGKPRVAECDVTDIKSVEGLGSTVERSFGRLDILVNNAGIGAFSSPLHLLPPEDWDRVIQTNLRGVYYCIRTFAPLMIGTGQGDIINISSITGKNA